jgi:nitrogen fixation NifU-like protein
VYGLRKYQPDQTDVSPFRHVRTGKIPKARTGGYGLLRFGARAGIGLRRPWDLLWQSVLTMDKLDAFLDKLQNEIFEEARKSLGEKGFHRWRNPKFGGRMENPDGYGRVTGECGDTMEIFLKFTDDRVSHASYVTNGCASSSISGSFAAELTLGRNPDELTDITDEKVLETISRLPEEDRHCAGLAARTVQEALNDYMIRQRDSK